MPMSYHIIVAEGNVVFSPTSSYVIYRYFMSRDAITRYVIRLHNTHRFSDIDTDKVVTVIVIISVHYESQRHEKT